MLVGLYRLQAIPLNHKCMIAGGARNTSSKLDKAHNITGKNFDRQLQRIAREL